MVIPVRLPAEPTSEAMMSAKSSPISKLRQVIREEFSHVIITIDHTFVTHIVTKSADLVIVTTRS